MDVIPIELLLVFWSLCGIASGMMAIYRNNSVTMWFFLGFVLGPLGVLCSMIAGDGIKCGYCAKSVPPKATKCPYCQTVYVGKTNDDAVSAPGTSSNVPK
jgi:hypothetical protein